MTFEATKASRMAKSVVFWVDCFVPMPCTSVPVHTPEKKNSNLLTQRHRKSKIRY
jgi:hypothetical protein